MKEEKKDEELKKLQVEAGLLPESEMEKMTWMYENPAAKPAEEEEGPTSLENFFTKPQEKEDDEVSSHTLNSDQLLE